MSDEKPEQWRDQPVRYGNVDWEKPVLWTLRRIEPKSQRAQQFVTEIEGVLSSAPEREVVDTRCVDALMETAQAALEAAVKEKDRAEREWQAGYDLQTAAAEAAVKERDEWRRFENVRAQQARRAEARAETAEQSLAEALEALRRIEDCVIPSAYGDQNPDWRDIALTTLSNLDPAPEECAHCPRVTVLNAEGLCPDCVQQTPFDPAQGEGE